jgi:inner membrane protein
MFLFGHTGLTLAAAASIDFVRTRIKSRAGNKIQLGQQNNLATRINGKTRLLTANCDLRLLLLGSLLPDIIDKPLGIYLLGDVFHNGRIFSHTLLFLLVLAVAGIVVQWRAKKSWLLVVAFGVFTHLLFDAAWNEPRTLLWPLLGSSFPQIQTEKLIMTWFHQLINTQSDFIPEILGFGVLVGVLVWLLKTGQFWTFVRKGRIIAPWSKQTG